MTQIVILAAGKGTRMRSALPKVLHTLAGKPFVQHVIDSAHTLSPSKTVVVVGHGGEQVCEVLADTGICFVSQEEQLGTGHAVQQALPEIDDNSPVLILYGDVPLIQRETLEALLEYVNAETMALLTIALEDPTGYGRIIRNYAGQVCAIVEEKDADTDQRDIAEVNTGIMAVTGAHLKSWLPRLSNDNAQGEYYLTDIIEMAVESGVRVQAVHPSAEWEVAGVNNRMQQAELERAYQHQLATEFLEQGLTLLDPNRFDVRGHLQHGSDCIIDINCVFEGDCVLGNNITVGPNCLIKNAKIGDGVRIEANSIIEDAEVAAQATIGPFARLRPGTVLEEGAKIGNFVETKKARIGKGSKVNHLSYIGDAELGDSVNIGAGTITCNYDGVNKSRTEIGDDVFVGSNSALVAPVKIARGATVGAGSVVTKDCNEDQLVVARARQRNMDGWARPTKK